MPRAALAAADPPDEPTPGHVTPSTTTTSISASPMVGQNVHFMGHGSAECMAAIVTRLCPDIPGSPNRNRCELVIFSPITPHPLYMTAEYDTNRGGQTWHHLGHP